MMEWIRFPIRAALYDSGGTTCRTPRRGVYPISQHVLQHVDPLHKRNLIILHYQAARLAAQQMTSSQDQGISDGPECLSDKISLSCEENIIVSSVYNTNGQLGTFYPHTLCANASPNAPPFSSPPVAFVPLSIATSDTRVSS